MSGRTPRMAKRISKKNTARTVATKEKAVFFLSESGTGPGRRGPD